MARNGQGEGGGRYLLSGHAEGLQDFVETLVGDLHDACGGGSRCDWPGMKVENGTEAEAAGEVEEDGQVEDEEDVRSQRSSPRLSDPTAQLPP